MGICVILLGGHIVDGEGHQWTGDARSWAETVKDYGYRAAYAPTQDPNDDRVAAFASAARTTGIVIAELGIWKNLICVDEESRRLAVATSKELLDLADRLEARCAVTFAGTRGPGLWGPSDENFSDDTFALLVDTVREILRDVRPVRTKLALETMQTVIPDSVESYVALVKAIDHDGFGVHFDPVNLLVSPRAIADQRAIIRSFVETLGARIVGCHAKDFNLT